MSKTGYAMRDKIQQKLGKAFDYKLADAVTYLTGVRKGSGGYDPVTGTTTESNTPLSCRGVLSLYKAHQINGDNILAGDYKLLCLLNEIDFEPALYDQLNDMHVIDWSSDAALSSISIQLRKI